MPTFLYNRYVKGYPDKKVKTVLKERETGYLFLLFEDDTSLRVKGGCDGLELTNFNVCGIEIRGDDNVKPEVLPYLVKAPVLANDLSLFRDQTKHIDLAVGFDEHGNPWCKCGKSGFQCQALRPPKVVGNTTNPKYFCGLGSWQQMPLRETSKKRGIVRPNKACPLHRKGV